MSERVQGESNGYMRSFYNGAVLGDFSDDESKTAGFSQIGVGLIPVVGQIADARDTIAALKDVYEGKPGSWKALGWSAVAWVPGIGDAAKACRKSGVRAALRAAGAAVKESFSASMATAKEVLRAVPLQFPTRVREGIREAWAGFKAEGFGGIQKGWDSVYERNATLSAERVALETESMKSAITTGAEIGEVLAREPVEATK
jgi:hypothetical protein